MRLAAVVAVTALAALGAAAPASADPAEVTVHCTSLDFVLPQGPPPRVGEMTVTLGNGRVVVHHFVPGPCSAPGLR